MYRTRNHMKFAQVGIASQIRVVLGNTNRCKALPA